VLFAAVGFAAIVAATRRCRHVIRFLPLQWAGHVATATITACRSNSEQDYVSLVGFTTRGGDIRDAVPLAGRCYTAPPLSLDQPCDVPQLRDEIGNWRGTE
jgi:hypothetical protein